MRTPSTTRRPARSAAAALLAAALAGGALAGCSSEAAPTASRASAAPTPIGQLNTSAMELARIEFCSLLPSSAVRTALEGRRGEGQRWRSGQEVAVAPGAADATYSPGSTGTDVVHENGCRWTSGDYSAAAWLFADPVSEQQARTLIRKAGQEQGCTTSRGPDFGQPSQRQTCTLTDGSRRARFTGLFDDTWLTCEVQAPSSTTAADLRARAAAWCVQVANATNTAR